MQKRRLLFIFYFILTISCTTEKEEMRFTYINSKHSNIDFSNTISENDSINVIDFQYCYNGGGVGIGDFNNDGLSDIVFTGNQVSSKLYINEGALQFKDISKDSGFYTESWVTGVSIIDINADGWDDIYLSVGGANCKNDCKNLLFINKGLDKNGTPFFNEAAEAYQLSDGRYSQQAVFLDFDLDGDLDAYLVHNGSTTFDKNSPIPKRYMPEHLSDYLLRNDFDQNKQHPVFTDVSDQMNIKEKGFGLGVGINDFNDDGLPDIYVSNDFITDDLMYLNKGFNENKEHLGFEEVSQLYLGHETYNAMGVDLADVNNDALPDILVLDMLPENYERQKRMLGIMNYDKYLLSNRNGYASQYMHNTLQLNNGFIENEPVKTSEIGFLAGISNTDWSWAPLMVDFDNDGDKDIYISNGYVKDITDLDFVNFSRQNNVFGTQEARNQKLRDLVKDVEGIRLSNFFYENKEQARFLDVSNKWMTENTSYSNGVAYADFDNDGDLDLAVNNINDKAFLIENHTTEKEETYYLRIKLKGNKKNAKAIGAKVQIWESNRKQIQYQNTIRGYLSSVEPILHFGLKNNAVDSLEVKWPQGNVTKLYKEDLLVNQTIEIFQNKSSSPVEKINTKSFLFKENKELLDFKHKENPSNDYVFQNLLMKQYSKSGPCIAAANIDKQKGDEIFIGGSKGFPGQLFKQNKEGVYELKQTLESIYEDTDAAFIDIDNDQDLDLYVASGSSEFKKDAPSLQDRIYINDGKGNYVLDKKRLPALSQATSCVRPSDIDNDGDIDFFIGSNLVPEAYPTIPENYILINNEGVFSSIKLSQDAIGMVADALWKDIDNDGFPELVTVGEWSNITFFKNNQGRIEPWEVQWENESGNRVKTTGWWNTIKTADFDNDGDLDFIAGNQGLNSYLKPTSKTPVYIYKKDFDNNGSPDPIIAQFFETSAGQKLLPIHSRDDIMKQLVKLKTKYLTYESFSQVDFNTLLEIEDIEKETLSVEQFESSYIENLGNGSFKIKALPMASQIAPIKDILIDDFDKDGSLDALLVGNDFYAETNYGRLDALNGLFLKGDKGNFTAISSETSGFYVPNQSNHLIKITDKDGNEYIVATQNNEKIKVFEL